VFCVTDNLLKALSHFKETMKHKTPTAQKIRHVSSLVVLGAGLVAGHNALAVDFGPFTLTGFAKAEVSRASNQCSDCQLNAGENRHRPWVKNLEPMKAM
jgi:hypothetical protein